MLKLDNKQGKKLLIALQGVVVGLLIQIITYANWPTWIIGTGVILLVYHVFRIAQGVMSDE